ncbi:L-threonylcarbamoyladenylate synthase [Halomarina oriensis]|uniref:L-threonylcarbamoyladenylate synthase n=1 Tax=Halomarina oriensis TaxID=671145 RepID=A0A6B0GHW3_9EURY|nr:L-threonylcarbamoyladenylate synthase [Halomarina oriensis]MWG34456.1 threonylcarbamoyl-AMP synthase [Halomarina oriensis]
MADDSSDSLPVSASALDSAAAAIRRGECVVYPTETVYGLGADAVDSAAVERVFAVKGRSRDKPVSLAVDAVDALDDYVRLSERERAFAEAFLPGPVTLVAERREGVPDVLTAGRDRVGVRVPDHPVALALLDRVETAVTATSANRSGTGSARTVDELAASIHEACLVLDAGETPGGGSTVVDVAAETVHRRGEDADAVERWLAEH